MVREKTPTLATREDIRTVKREMRSSPTVEGKWWNVPEDRLPETVMASVTAIINNSKNKKDLWRLFLSMYENKPLNSLDPLSLSRASLSGKRLSLNVVKSCVDTICAKLSKNRPKPQILTVEGDFELQEKAEKLNRFLEGVLLNINAYETGQLIFRDACVLGTGIAQIYHDGENINMERVFINELVVDEAEAAFGDPRSIHRVKYIDPEVLAETFPDSADAILAASTVSYKPDLGDAKLEKVKVVESWRLPNGPKAKGVHAVTVPGATLLKEDYEDDFFPFVFLRWSEPNVGFYGIGLAEELREIQREINAILINLSKAHHFASGLRVFLERGSNVQKQHITDQVGSIIEFTGQPPVFNPIPAAAPETYAHLRWLIEQAYSITGVAQSMATGKREEGITSGVAIREREDIQSERFVLIGQRYENFFLAVAQRIIAMARKLYADGVDVKAKSSTKRQFIESIKWSEVDMDDDTFTLQVFPASWLPSTPAAKLQFVSELAQANLIPRDQILQLLDWPDTQEYTANELATYHDAKSTVIRIIKDNAYVAPDPLGDLELQAVVARQQYLRAKTMKHIPSSTLNYLQLFIDECMAMLSPPEPTTMGEPSIPSATPEPPPMSSAPAAPVSPPHSDLLPTNP